MGTSYKVNTQIAEVPKNSPQLIKINFSILSIFGHAGID